MAYAPVEIISIIERFCINFTGLIDSKQKISLFFWHQSPVTQKKIADV